MKRRFLVFEGAVALIAALLLISPLVNNATAKAVERELRSTPLPERTTCIDSLSKAGKLNGNGNGMQYFGAMLVESELSLEALDEYYRTYRQGAWDFLVQEQKTASIEQMEHETLTFSSNLSPEASYYMIYSWGKGSEPFASLDLRGH